MPVSVLLLPDVHRALVAAVAAAWPDEAVALLAGRRDGGVWTVEGLQELRGARCAHDRFVVPAEAFAAAEAALRASGRSFLGFLHSHPGGATAPSSTDRDTLWRDCLQLIAAVDAQATVDLAAFVLVGDSVHHLPLAVGDAPAKARA